MKNILIVNPFGIGDVLFTTPLLKAIKTSLPEAKIGFLCNRRVYPLIKDIPFIDWVFVYERDEMEDIRRRSLLLWLRAHRKLIGEIREKRFDAAIDLSLNTKFGAFLWLAGIKKRIGYDYKKRGKFLNYKIPLEGYREKHIIEYHLELLRFANIKPAVFPMEINIPEKDAVWASRFLDSCGIKNGKFICLAPGGGESFGKEAYRKLWPKEKFIELCCVIEKQIPDYKIGVVLGPKERGLSEGFPPSVVIFPYMPLEKVAATISLCSLFISNDNGLMRIANSLGRKIVVLFGPTSEKVYSPYPPDSQKHIVITKDVPCRPCYQNFRLPPCPYNLRCLREISAEEVFEAVKKLLK